MILFLPKFTINVMILILNLSIFPFLDGDKPPMEFIVLNTSYLLMHLAMLLTLTLAINCTLINLLNKAINIINFPKLF